MSTSTTSTSTSNTTMPADYDARASQFGLASKSQIEACLSSSTSSDSSNSTSRVVYVIDVRSPTEIDDAGRWDLSSSSQSQSQSSQVTVVVKPVTIHGVTPADASPVVDWWKKEEIIREDDTKFVLYCRSGRRADAAIQALKKEISNCEPACFLNAGGLDDLKGMGFPTTTTK